MKIVIKNISCESIDISTNESRQSLINGYNIRYIVLFSNNELSGTYYFKGEDLPGIIELEAKIRSYILAIK